MTDTLLSFKDATIFRQGSTALHHINWTVLKKENWVILGAMASGKTSLLQAIAGQLSVKSGAVDFTPNDVRIDRWELSKHVNLASFSNYLINGTDFYYQQRYNFAPSEFVPTVEKFLGKFDRKDSRLKTLRIHELLPLELVKLSNGQTRRVILAKALLSRPQLLLLDNPFAGLDTDTRKGLRDLIEDLLHYGQKIILTCTHIDDIPPGMTHLLYMQNSAISFQGTLHDGVAFASRAASLVYLNGRTEFPVHQIPAAPFVNALELRNVTIQYGDKLVLNQVNWIVKRKEKWALLGKNGSGKSSLLSLLNADNPQAYKNDILLFDEKREYGRSIWQIKKRIGFFSPELHAYFNEDLSVADTIATGYTDTFVPKKDLTQNEETRMRELLAYYSMEGFLNRRYRNLSSGEQRLILFIRSLVKNVDLLILDEPFQGFDHSLIERSRLLLDDYCKEITLIVVTHYPEEVPSCVTNFLTLRDGKVA